MIEACAKRGLKLTTILVTHHHADRVGALGSLRSHLFAALRLWKNNFK